MSTDEEAEIRSKISDAIRLQLPLVGNMDFVFLRANRPKLSIPVSVGEYSYMQVKLLSGPGAIYVELKSGLNCVIDHEDLPGE